jgi:hypothetical protein
VKTNGDLASDSLIRDNMPKDNKGGSKKNSSIFAPAPADESVDDQIANVENLALVDETDDVDLTSYPSSVIKRLIALKKIQVILKLF